MRKLFKAFSYPEVVWLPKSERTFLGFICIAFMLAMFATPNPNLAMWVGFLFAAYAAIANDSIQTIGTFIASNQDKKWWMLWIFIGGIFVATMSYSWFNIDETGITVFSNKVEKEIPYESRKLDFYANYTINQENGKIEEGSSLRIEKISASKIKYYVVNYKGDRLVPEILGEVKYTTTYRNEDYGLSFYINKSGEICEINNITKDSSKTTFNKYTIITYTNANGVKEYEEISYDKKGRREMLHELYGDGVRDKDVSHARLSAKGFEQAPRNFHFLQVAAAIFLLILTRLRMPVSTTFILLTSFAASPAAVGSVLAKSMSGYILSFIMGLFFFMLIAKSAKKYFTGEAKFGWTIAQWITSGTLWSVWLMQDAANIAVYLPRSLDTGGFFGFISIIVIGLGLLLYYKGGRIQKIVTEKSVVTDVRFATLIDLIYCIILFYFKLHSKVPMSTTWVFIGLLAGRELGMAIMNTGENNIWKSIKLGLKDMSYALIGLVISIAIAIGVNDQLTVASMFETIPQEFTAGVVKFFSKIGF